MGPSVQRLAADGTSPGSYCSILKARLGQTKSCPNLGAGEAPSPGALELAKFAASWHLHGAINLLNSISAEKAVGVTLENKLNKSQ